MYRDEPMLVALDLQRWIPALKDMPLFVEVTPLHHDSPMQAGAPETAIISCDDIQTAIILAESDETELAVIG